MNDFPASEKVLIIISECLKRESGKMDITEIIEILNCSYKTASRVMNKINDMQYQAGFYYSEIISGHENRYNDLRKEIIIKLDRKYL